MIKAEWTNADALNLQPTCNQLATDCISRQAAIDALDCINGAEEVLRALPTVDAVEVVRCADCKHSYESVAWLICSYMVCVDCVVRDDFYCAYAERRQESEE